MRFFLQIVCLLLFLFSSFTAFADGSKDLYPRGVRGGRAFLESVTYANGMPAHNFYSYARHFAYLKNGETISVASSAQGVRNGTIRVISPSGAIFNSGNDLVTGRIVGSNGQSNREAELAGPRDGYQPLEIKSTEDGIWRVEFFTPDSTSNNNGIPNVFADENWTQPDDRSLIAAWDVSVRNSADTEWLQGRVFVNVLNIHMHGGNMAEPNRAFFGVNYVLTKDGYYYKVDGNGSIGLKFTYFVNNSGILNSDGLPSYKSSVDGYYARVHNPNMPDIGNEYVTHKIFYSLPNLDLPKVSRSFRGSTWLLNDIVIPKVDNIVIKASENTIKNVNVKGATISFRTNYAGRYKVSIKSIDSLISFPVRNIIYLASAENNTVIWDGIDGEGKFVPAGEYQIQASIASIEGEVHFPYFDTEINPNGLKLERIERTINEVRPAILYWDDSDIPRGQITSEHSNPIVNLNGIPSNINGHRWGTYNVSSTSSGINNNLFTGAYSFGNNMAIDTWSYAVQIEETQTKEIVVNVADLEVIDLEVDKDTIKINERVTYKIRVRNNGPSDAEGARFEYLLPQGFIIENVQFKNSECANIGAVSISNNKFQVPINIKNGCIGEFTVRTYAANVPGSTYGVVEAEAGMVRPIGYTDPDATLSDNSVSSPKSAREECSEDGCNNIKTNNEVLLLEPENERGKVALRKTVRHIDTNGNGFQEEGEFLEYTFTTKNVGFVALHSMIITDSIMVNPTMALDSIVLAPNQEYTITQMYTITAHDSQQKSVQNQATILGKNPRNFDVKDVSGTEFSTNNPTIIDINKSPIVQLKKTVINKGTGENEMFTLGDSITYVFEIKHQGDISVERIMLTDQLLFSEPRLVFAGKIDNQTLVFHFSYLVDEAEIARGFVENTARVEVLDSKYKNTIRDTSGTSFENAEKTITEIATAPLAENDFIEIYQGNSTQLNVLRNDTKGSSNWDRGRIEIIEPPGMGRIEHNGMTIRFIQHDNFQSGLDSFTYRVHDNSRLMSNIVRVDINILKTIPMAINDLYLLQYNSNFTLKPMENDFVHHSELDIENITIINQPLNGRLQYLGNGEFKYESEKTFSGIDEFTYRIMDKNGNWSEPATVKIEIVGILIPNVITPNGDGLNDTFAIIGLYKFESVELQVFDRFKNLIHEDANYKNNWQVSNIVRDGTYFYILKLNMKRSKPIIKKGSLLITRELLN